MTALWLRQKPRYGSVSRRGDVAGVSRPPCQPDQHAVDAAAPAKYVALLSKRHVLDQPALGIMGPLPERVIYPDPSTGSGKAVAVTRVKESIATYAVMGAPVIELINPWVEEVPLLTVEIKDVAERRLVTVIEVLSPVNKRGDGAREYFLRREDILSA